MGKVDNIAPWICPRCNEEMYTKIEKHEVMKELMGRYTIHYTCPKCKYWAKDEAPASFMKKGMG